jgi:hypothetical protein
MAYEARYTWDASGRVVRTAIDVPPDSYVVNYAYTPTLDEAVITDGVSIPRWRMRYERDKSHRLVRKIIMSATTGLEAARVEITWDTAGNLLAVRVSGTMPIPIWDPVADR